MGKQDLFILRPMTDPSLLLAALTTKQALQPDSAASSAVITAPVVAQVAERSPSQAWANVQPETAVQPESSAQPPASPPSTVSQPQPKQRLQPVGQGTGSSLIEFSDAAPATPRSGPQLYAQRLAALRLGRLYTRLPATSFRSSWLQADRQPSYGQWRQLLALEARAVAGGQGNNRLAVMVGDSLSLWFPSDRLPTDQLWLNQAISGETTRQILYRLSDFSRTRPSVIYLMAGVNDLKQGVNDNEILWNLRQIMTRLRVTHPQANLVVQSILPTRVPHIPNARIVSLNRRIASLASQEGAIFLNLHALMVGQDGNLRPELTTDGLHLSQVGYEVWQWGLLQAETWIARAEARFGS